MEQFNPDQRFAFLRVWVRLPPHPRETALVFHDPGWNPPAFKQLGDVLCDFLDVFPTPRRRTLGLAP